MENKRQSATSSSSIASDLFGPKDSSPSSSIFGSIFPPAPPMMRRDPPPAQDVGTMRKQDPGNHYGFPSQANPDNAPRGSKKSDHAHPHHFSSSIYYGGQESYSPHSGTVEPQPALKKKAGKDGNGSNSNAASRGNWWEGSLYY